MLIVDLYEEKMWKIIVHIGERLIEIELIRWYELSRHFWDEGLLTNFYSKSSLLLNDLLVIFIEGHLPYF